MVRKLGWGCAPSEMVGDVVPVWDDGTMRTETGGIELLPQRSTPAVLLTCCSNG